MTETILVAPSPGGKGLNEATVEPPLGLAYMASMLETKGHRCRIIDANVLGLTPSEVLQDIPESASLVGISVNSFTFASASTLASAIKSRNPQTKVILGGPLPSAAPELVIDSIACDGIVRGEGEYAIVAIVENLRSDRDIFDSNVPGAMWRDKATGELLSNPIGRVTDLDALPFPALHLLPPLKKYKSRCRKTPVGAIITSRGCAHKCSFCSKDIFQRKVTLRSPENVLAEIDFLVKTYRVGQIDILDDNFAFNSKRFDAILDGLISRNYGLAINCQSGLRSETLTRERLTKMKRAGIYKLAFGIESVDPAVLEMCDKKLDVTKLAQVIKDAKELGFVVYGFFIIGLPGETEKGFDKTLEFAQTLDLDVANFTMAVPFIGTELFRQVEKKGTFLVDTTKNIDSGFYGGDPFFLYGDTTAEQLRSRYKKAYSVFYSWRKRLKIILTIRSLSEFRWLVKAALSI